MTESNRNLCRIVGIIVGIGLTIAALWISFYNPVSAGFFFVTAAATLCVAVLDVTMLKSLTLSPGSVGLELFERAEKTVIEAEEILADIRTVERRVVYALSEQLLNRGGEHYVGGFGEEAKFNIFAALSANSVGFDPAVTDNLAELKRRLSLHMLYAVMGTRNLQKTPATLAALLSSDYKCLPSSDQLRKLAETDGVIIDAEVTDMLAAYHAFAFEDEHPSDDVVRIIYALSNRS